MELIFVHGRQLSGVCALVGQSLDGEKIDISIRPDLFVWEVDQFLVAFCLSFYFPSHVYVLRYWLLFDLSCLYIVNCLRSVT